MNNSSVYETTECTNMHVHRATQKQEQENVKKRNNDQTFHKFGEKYQLRVPRSSANPKQDEYKENHT